MPAQQIDPIFAAKFFLRVRNLKCRAIFVQPNFLRAPVVFFAKADADNFRFRARRDFFRPFVVAVHKQFSVRRQQFRQPAFFLRHARDIAKKFQMLAPDVRDDAELRLNHFHERREFARMIRAGFQHRGLMRFFQPQQGQRHADVVVETRLAPQRRKFLPQHRREQFLHRRFAVRAADRNHRQIKIFPISRRQFSERDSAHRPPPARRNPAIAREFFSVPRRPPPRLSPRLRSKNRGRQTFRLEWQRTNRPALPAANRCRHFSPKFPPRRAGFRRRRLRRQISKSVLPQKFQCDPPARHERSTVNGLRRNLVRRNVQITRAAPAQSR